MAMHRVALFGAALLLVGASPQRAPTRFTSHLYQLTARIPPGLFQCPGPAGGAILDHGIRLYLAKPSCGVDAPVAFRSEADHPPQIRLYYAGNANPGTPPGADVHSSRTNTELHRQACHDSRSAWPTPMTVLGVAAATCFERRGGTIFFAAGTLYRQTMALAEPPDSQAWLILNTTARRYPYDMAIFRAILNTIAVCRSSDRPPQPPRPACPNNVETTRSDLLTGQR